MEVANLIYSMLLSIEETYVCDQKSDELYILITRSNIEK